MTERDAFGNPTAPAGTSSPAPQPAPISQPGPPAPRPAAYDPTAPGHEADTLGWIALGCSVGGIFVVPLVLSIVALVLCGRARRAAGDGPRPGQIRAASIIGWIGIVFWGAIPALVVVALAIHASGN